jgi:hypothetical protein
MSEFERSDILELANIASAVNKTLRQYERAHTLSNHRHILARGRNLIGYILAGSLRSEPEVVERLLPEGADVYESVRAYRYAKEVWTRGQDSPLDDAQFFTTLHAYAACLDQIESRKPFDEWSPAQVRDLSGFTHFLRELERLLSGKLNSRHAASLIQESA